MYFELGRGFPPFLLFLGSFIHVSKIFPFRGLSWRRRTELLEVLIVEDRDTQCIAYLMFRDLAIIFFDGVLCSSRLGIIAAFVIQVLLPFRCDSEWIQKEEQANTSSRRKSRSMREHTRARNSTYRMSHCHHHYDQNLWILAIPPFWQWDTWMIIEGRVVGCFWRKRVYTPHVVYNQVSCYSHSPL